jgi:glucosamine-6-phosphate deaminase
VNYDGGNPENLAMGEYEPDTSVFTTAKDVGLCAANLVGTQLKEDPLSVLGLPTGGTALAMYEELVRLYNNGLDFSRTTFFNPDEYIGLPPEHPQSYHAYMKHNLFDHINANPNNIFIPNGMALDIEQECTHYENAIKTRGGIKLQLLGVGRNSHLGHCEPGTPFDSRTHKSILAQETRQDNARFFYRLEDVPSRAITIGLATMLQAERIILLATGEQKSKALYALLRQPVSIAHPVTILRRHQRVQLLADRDAFSPKLFGNNPYPSQSGNIHFI